MIPTVQAPIVNLFTPEYYRNPYLILERLRHESPVFQTKNPFGATLWYVTRYEDNLAILKNDALYSKQPLEGTPIDAQFVASPLMKPINDFIIKPLLNPVLNPFFTNMLDQDAPNHTRLRHLVHKAFTPKVIGKMQGSIEAITHELLDKMQAKRDVDFINEFAFPLPIRVISELLGVPNKDQDKFKVWSTTITEFNRNVPKLMYHTYSLNNYLTNLLNEKRKNPQEDLLSELVKVQEENDALSQDELVSMAVLLIIAGHETTVNLLGNGLMALLQYPEPMNALRDNPSLMKNAIEEILRYDSPVHMATDRYAREDHEISGVKIQRGDLMGVGIGAGNRDPQMFDDPHTLNIYRENVRHLSFGQGIHYCLGAPLARMEASFAFSAILERFEHIEMRVPLQQLDFRANPLLRGVTQFPIRVS
jgi:cytochrome P450 family 107 subfamily K polypeptide 1